MHEKQLRKLIDEGESVTLEFKSWIMCKNYNEIKDLAIKSAVALANARGGKCLLGVENDGSITGCPTTKTSQDLMDTIYNGTKPSLFTDIELVGTDEGSVFVISVDAVSIPVATSTGVYFRRLGKTSKPFFPVSETYKITETMDFSSRIIEELDESAIDHMEVYRLKEKLRITDSTSTLPDMDDITFLDNLELIQKGEKRIQITVAGLLFAGKAQVIREYIPQAEVIYLHYSSDEQIEYDNRLDMQFPLIKILDTLQERIKAYNKLINIQVGLFRLEVYAFSDAVFQEALLNALTHRSYDSPAPIYIRHYPGKIVIENPGGFPDDITVNNIITHQSFPRNRLIALTLQRLKYVQRSGQGVDIMFRSMLIDGKPYPEYSAAPESIRLTLYSTIENKGCVKFVAEEQDRLGHLFSLPKLMILRYLYDHRKIKLIETSNLIQESNSVAHRELEQLRTYGLIEPSGKEYMLTARVYEAVKSDVAYIVDKTISQIQAESRIQEYLTQKPSITSATVQQLCGFNKDQAYRILSKMCGDEILIKNGKGRGTNYSLKKNY